MVGENPTPYGILALWAVNGLSIVYWDYMYIVILIFFCLVVYTEKLCGDFFIFMHAYTRIYRIYRTFSDNFPVDQSLGGSKFPIGTKEAALVLSKRLV